MNSADELHDASVLARVSGLCLRGYTANQLLRDIDAVSMAHSLEVRVPYLDVAVADTALSLPDSSKLGDLEGVSRPEMNTYRSTGAKRVLIDAGIPCCRPISTTSQNGASPCHLTLGSRGHLGSP